jgi:hypothetical protein
MQEHTSGCTTSTPKPLTADEIITDFVLQDPEQVRKTLNNLLIEFMSLTEADQEERADIICAYWSVDKLLGDIIYYLKVGRVML